MGAAGGPPPDGVAGPRRIAIVQGHPDPAGNHFGHVLAAAYAEGARAAGRDVTLITIAALDFPPVRSKREWENDEPPASIRAAQEQLAAADHIVFVYPLWLGDMPAVMKAFLEQVARPGFIRFEPGGSTANRGRLAGKSARVIVTMGMPGFVYRWYFLAHSLKSLERNILRFVGIKPVRTTIVGMIEAKNGAHRNAWIRKVRAFGTAGT